MNRRRSPSALVRGWAKVANARSTSRSAPPRTATHTLHASTLSNLTPTHSTIVILRCPHHGHAEQTFGADEHEQRAPIACDPGLRALVVRSNFSGSVIRWDRAVLKTVAAGFSRTLPAMLARQSTSL